LGRRYENLSNEKIFSSHNYDFKFSMNDLFMLKFSEEEALVALLVHQEVNTRGMEFAAHLMGNSLSEGS
tara:strand:- start:1283 stop:1489 length:207 start_codon:yes stop_codon:yes gene_type:complete